MGGFSFTWVEGKRSTCSPKTFILVTSVRGFSFTWVKGKRSTCSPKTCILVTSVGGFSLLEWRGRGVPVVQRHSFSLVQWEVSHFLSEDIQTWRWRHSHYFRGRILVTWVRIFIPGDGGILISSVGGISLLEWGYSYLSYRCRCQPGLDSSGVYICKSIVNYLRHGNFICKSEGIYLTYEHRNEIPVEFTYVNQ